VTRICITGGPRTGKTTMALELARAILIPVRHTDDLICLGWSGASQVASEWLDEPGPWVIEGVAVSRALRKWRDRNPDAPPPVDRVVYLRVPYETLTAGQAAMAKGVSTVHNELAVWLKNSGVGVHVSDWGDMQPRTPRYGKL
jgi:dephospho-CoA kinase